MVKKRHEMVALRARKGLTQKQVAEMMGINVGTLNRVETGNRNGTHEFWRKYKELFNLDGDTIWKLQNHI